MPPKKNPLGLNKLQLKALTLLQAYAETGQGVSDETDGEMTITVPPPHGDHFHVGEYVVFLKDATGLINKGVWAALERKGLIKPLVFPTICTLTRTGLDYDTGVRDSILHRSGH
jgi:hypothetical protein